MSFDPYEFDRDYGQSSRMESIGQYTAKTFLWMVLGLLVTFGIALLGWVTNATLYALAYVPYIHLIVLIATIVLSITMVSRIEKMSVGTARGIFIAFSALFGFTMSMYLYIFEFGSLIFVFLATAAYFAVLAAYGYFTKADLTRLRPILSLDWCSCSYSRWSACLSPALPPWTGSSAWRASPSSWAILPMIPRRSKPTTTTMRATPTCWRRRLFSPPFSCTWISSTCFCTCCAFWASPGIERAAEQRKRGPVSQTGPLSILFIDS